jgi:GT2 family glycosyltransferase
LNTQELQVVSSINMGILTAEGAFKTIEKDIGQYDDEIEIFWASGACFFIRSVVYRELRGFDDDFLPIRKKSIWRAINKGYSIKYNYKSTVYHGRATLQQGNPKKTF